MSRPTLKSLLLGFALCGLLGACAETGPLEAPQSLASTGKPLHNFNANDVVTIYDHFTGEPYTLDPAAHRVWLANDDFLQLDDTTTANFADAFQGALIADAQSDDLVNAVANWIPGGGCTPETPCPEPMSIGGSILMVDTPDGDSSSATGTFLIRRSGSGTVLVGRGSPFELRVTQQIGARQNNAGFGGTVAQDYSGGGVCTDVANAAASTANNWRAVRGSIVKDVLPSATATTVQIIKNGIPKTVKQFVAPAGTFAYTITAQKLADNAYARIRVGLLAAYWNTYNCSSQRVTAGPFLKIGGPYGGGGAGYTLECKTEQWEISFDSGKTWQPIDVEVCTYVQM